MKTSNAQSQNSDNTGSLVHALLQSLAGMASMISAGDCSDEFPEPPIVRPDVPHAHAKTLKLALLLALLAFATPALGGEHIAPGGVFQPGETLRYSVTWKFLRLGTLSIRTERDTTSSDGSEFTVIMKVESNPTLQFLWIREVNEAHIEASSVTSRHFLARHRNGDDLVEIRHQFDPATRTAITSLTDMNMGKLLRCDTVYNATPYVDGASLVFKARELSRTIGRVPVPTMIDGRLCNTTLEMGGDVESLHIDAWGQEIRTRRYSAHADWTGGTSSGLGGESTGWVSDDEAAVPIRAEMKILLGSIVLELEQWTRTGWVPPPVMQNALAPGGGK